MDVNLLVNKAKHGDKDALVELIMLKKDEYYKLAYIYVKNRDDALDILEDMIVILYENINKLKNTESFYSWSKTILVNCCKSHLRRGRKVVNLESMDEVVYEENFDHMENQIVLSKHLEKLNIKHKEVIELRYFLDMDYKTIAEIVKIPVGTVKSRISIGLRKLKESLGGEWK